MYQRVVHQICNWAKYQNKHSSKSIKVIKLSFYQNDSPMGGSFWQKDSLITYILFELCLFWYLSPVANLMHHSLVRASNCLVKWSLFMYCKFFQIILNLGTMGGKLFLKQQSYVVQDFHEKFFQFPDKSQQSRFFVNIL